MRLESLAEYRDAQAAGAGGGALEASNDERILRSLMYHASGAGGGHAAGDREGGRGGVRLWTDDVNFALMAEAGGVPTLACRGGALPGVLSALGLEYLDEGMELDAAVGEEGFVPLPSARSARSAYARADGTRSCPPGSTRTPTSMPAGVPATMPPPGTLQAAVARLRSPCPAPLRGPILTALGCFARRSGFGLPDAGGEGEDGADACECAVRGLIAAVDASALSLREQGLLGGALRTLLRYVGPREVGQRLVRDDEVRDAVRVLDQGSGEWAPVLEALA